MYSLNQIRIFKEIIKKVQDNGINPGLIHSANSGAVIGYPDSYSQIFNMVRPGIMIYGYYPSIEQKRDLDLKPVMEFKTRVSFIKTVEKDTPISYGLTYKTHKKTQIATLPVGYADGYSRLLSNKGSVCINNKIYPIVGRVCMDLCLVDLGMDSDIKENDEVILFGPGSGCMDAEEIAKKMNTISYEVTCLISKRVPRIYRMD